MTAGQLSIAVLMLFGARDGSGDRHCHSIHRVDREGLVLFSYRASAHLHNHNAIVGTFV
jgi:hypothetical protein